MKYNILYVDDEQDNLLAFKAVFRRHYNIHLAEGGEEALRLLRENEIDLVVSDQIMPHMTGVELLEKVKDEYPDLIRIVLTGYSDMQAIIDAINKGQIYHYMNKPYNPAEFKIIMDKALETYSLRLKNRALEKENVHAQFEILKNQINPHFLFNSMNILSALIPASPEKALSFTRKFSKLYRSMLDLKPQPVISLREELEFVRTYVFLQKMRFEDSLTVDIDIPDSGMDYVLPPFALQILVENTVKHNIISADSPLKVRIYRDSDYLCVRNNLQKRGYVEDSTGLGLKNLKGRYKMITDQPVILEEEENKFFLARIPLIPEG